MMSWVCMLIHIRYGSGPDLTITNINFPILTGHREKASIMDIFSGGTETTNP
jgi:hypothetical protein